jgi:hypothetical protein
MFELFAGASAAPGLRVPGVFGLGTALAYSSAMCEHLESVCV